MTAPSSTTLSEDLKETYPYLQEILREKTKGTPLSTAAATVDYVSSWIFPSYGRLTNAHQNKAIHILAGKRCVFDYTKQKIGGAFGAYPTINQRKIVYHKGYFSSSLIEETEQTDYFEIRDEHELQIIEFFNDFPDPPMRTWTVHNPLEEVMIQGEREFCYLGKLKADPNP